MSQLIKEIKQLKKEKNAIILAHNYQTKEIFEIADHIWDSYDLSIKAKQASADIIVFAWVKFMAESAKLLNPSKKVLLPTLEAGCFMASLISAKNVIDLKVKFPNAKVVSYVNTFADVKAESDACCTSANALKIVENIDSDEIIFTPDRNLWEYVKSKINKKIHIWDKWYCFLHEQVSDESLLKAKSDYPEAILLMHPETPLSLHKFADFIYWTWGMLKHVRSCSNVKNAQFLIATESNMCERLEFEFPNMKFIPLMWRCRFMAKINLENIRDALLYEQHEIDVVEEVAPRALRSLEEMIRLGV